MPAESNAVAPCFAGSPLTIHHTPRQELLVMPVNTLRDLETLCDALGVPREAQHWVIRRAAGRPDPEVVVRNYAAQLRRDKQADQK